MILRQRTIVRLALVGGAAPAALLLGAGPALAATDVTVSNTETVQAHLDASGKVKDKRVYEQLAFTGKGSVNISNPVSDKGLRNLDGFGGYDVKDGKLVTKVDVDGAKRLRTVSDFTKALPLEVAITYSLDGREVKPGDVVGKSGVLEVKYKVTNVTGKSGSVSYDDGTGKQVSKDAQVVIPMVGSLSTTLPSSFTEVQSDQANMAGDGRGGTKLSFTMTLFPPIGSDTAEFGYKARIRDGVVPPASISALPVNPLQSPSFKGGAESYAGGAATGAQLTDGAIQIDQNLLKLRDGASTLLAGLIKLKDGANQLNDGLAGKAAPGAAKLADGAGRLKAGTGDLLKGTGDAKTGAGQLAAGTGDLAAGSNDLADGSSDLAVGAGDLSDGLGLILKGIDDLPSDIKSDPDFQDLKGALSTMQAKIGDSNDVPNVDPTKTTLLGGINGVRYGLRSPVGLACDQSKSTSTPADDCGVGDAAELISKKLGAAAAAGGDISKLVSAGVGAYQLSGCPAAVGVPIPPVALPPATPATACQLISTVVYGLGLPAGVLAQPPGGLQAQTQAAADKLDLVQQGVGQLGDRSSATLLGGLTLIKLGVSNPSCNLAKPKDPANPCGLRQAAGLVSGGIDQLVVAIADGLGDAVNQAYLGAGQVADGAAQVADGADQVAGGAGQLADGADQLDAGLQKIKSGAGQLDDGAGQLSDGANQLNSGLQDAATGSGKLADGLDQAAGGAPALKNGAQQLSDQGSKVLIGKGKETAQTFGEKYALIKAGADRAQAESMAYGAPEGATGQTAYTLEIAGADGEGGRNWGRGLGALAVFAIGGGAAAAIRQRLV